MFRMGFVGSLLRHNYKGIGIEGESMNREESSYATLKQLKLLGPTLSYNKPDIPCAPIRNIRK